MKTVKEKLQNHPYHVSCDFGITHFNLTKRTQEFVDEINEAQAAGGIGPDKRAPNKPSGLSTVATSSSITLSWNTPNDNVGVVGFLVAINGGPLIDVATNSYTFTDLTSSTRYSMTVSAYDAAGNVSRSSSTTASTLAGVTTTSTTSTTTAPPTTTTTTTSGSTTTTTTSGTTTTSTSTSTSTSSTTSTTTTFQDTTPPSTPSGLSVTSTQTSLTLSWTASTDNVGIGGYVVTNGFTTVQTSATSWTFGGLNSNTTYTLGVSAFDTSGNYSNSAEIQGTTLTPTGTNTAVILCDFDGYLVHGTAWNTNGDIDCTPSGLTLDEQQTVINNMRVDYAPYNVYITADEGVYNSASPTRRTRIVFTTYSSWYGSAGGVAFIGSMNWGDNTPCFVFTALLGYSTRNIYTAGSHEAGHTIGLRHQSVYDVNCVKTSEYNYGPVNGIYAPTMGAAYSRPPIWWTGPSSVCCTCIQDDNAMLLAKLGAA